MLLKVLDFGISKAPAGADLSLTPTWSMLGSPAYMSPEQMRSARDVDAADRHLVARRRALRGCVEGHLPFEAESFSEMCVMVAADAPEPMLHAPPQLAAIVARCLAKVPDQRYQNVAELGRDLAALAREPARALLLVDRMSRTLGRALNMTANRQSPPGSYTPPPQPIATPLPVAAATSARFAASANSGHLLDSATTIDAVPLSLTDMRVRPRRRALWAVLAALAAVAIAAIVIQRTRTELIIESVPGEPRTGALPEHPLGAEPAHASGAAGSGSGSAEPTHASDPPHPTAAPAAGSAERPDASTTGSAAPAPPARPPRPVPAPRPRPHPAPVPHDDDPYGNPHGPGHVTRPVETPTRTVPPRPPEPAGSNKPDDCKDPFSSRKGC